jgi:Sulfotransferase family
MSASREGQKRKPAFRRNTELEKLLRTLNRLLACSENAALKHFPDGLDDHPVIFVMGPHRSGTTLFMQWLARSGLAAYPTNLLSRFYGAPVIGAQVQLLLTDPRFNFRNEILDFNSPISFESQNGKTQGALAPNEFWYFWRRFLPFGELDWLPDEELFRVVDREKMVAELSGLTRVFGKPFALKAMILNYNIPFLDAVFKKALFVRIQRNPLTNVASILEARRRQQGSKSEWYSFKIPEYPQLKDLDPVTQSAGQLYYINKAVSRGMSSVTTERKLVVQYEEFCADPGAVFQQLIERLDLERRTCPGPERFELSRNHDLSRREAIQEALSKFEVS